MTEFNNTAKEIEKESTSAIYKTVDTFYKLGETAGHMRAINQVFDLLPNLTIEQQSKLLQLKP